MGRGRVHRQRGELDERTRAAGIGQLTHRICEPVAQVHAGRSGTRPAGDQAEAHPRLRPQETHHGILHRIRETRGGALYDARFGARGRGEGPYAAAIQQLFTATAARLGLRTGADRGTIMLGVDERNRERWRRSE